MPADQPIERPMKVEQTAPNTIVVNGFTLSFPMDIWKVLPLRDRVVILVNALYWDRKDPERSRNAYCYANDGTLLWRVEASGEQRVEHGEVVSHFGYLGFEYDEAKDKLEAIGAECEFEIDKDTGRIIAFRFRDRF